MGSILELWNMVKFVLEVFWSMGAISQNLKHTSKNVVLIKT